MSYPYGSTAKLEFAKLEQAIGKLAVLAIRLNADTELSVFLDIAGHVDSYTLEVGKDKEANYNVRLIEEDVEYKYDYTPSDEDEFNPDEEHMFYVRALEKTEYLVTRLEKLLKEHSPGLQPEKLW